VKSLSESNPDFGLASAPVDVHLYVDGRAHPPVDAAVVALFEAELTFVEVDRVELAFAEVLPLPVQEPGRH
jgi:hypothetical protein